jgi:antitoxin HigA-1
VREYSIRINDRWRVHFRFAAGDAFDVEITDYHWGVKMARTSGLAAIHPGEFLAEILAELGVSQAAFARAIGVSPMRVSHVIGGSRPVTAELALLFGKALDQSPEYWLNLQSAYDLATARSAVGARLKGMRPLPQVAWPDGDRPSVQRPIALRPAFVGVERRVIKAAIGEDGAFARAALIPGWRQASRGRADAAGTSFVPLGAEPGSISDA